MSTKEFRKKAKLLIENLIKKGYTYEETKEYLKENPINNDIKYTLFILDSPKIFPRSRFAQVSTRNKQEDVPSPKQQETEQTTQNTQQQPSKQCQEAIASLEEQLKQQQKLLEQHVNSQQQQSSTEYQEAISSLQEQLKQQQKMLEQYIHFSNSEQQHITHHSRCTNPKLPVLDKRGSIDWCITAQKCQYPEGKLCSNMKCVPINSDCNNTKNTSEKHKQKEDKATQHENKQQFNKHHKECIPSKPFLDLTNHKPWCVEKCTGKICADLTCIKTTNNCADVPSILEELLKKQHDTETQNNNHQQNVKHHPDCPIPLLPILDKRDNDNWCISYKKCQIMGQLCDNMTCIENNASCDEIM